MTVSEPPTQTPPLWVRTSDGVSFHDVPEQAGGRMPDFCIIGAAKAGTTALNAMLSRHPDLFVCDLKEPHYFSTKAILDRGEQWYRGLYAKALPDQLCGEASTSYTRYPLVHGTAERMHAANPRMKLIYILREPVSRVESECLQTLKYMKNVLGEDYTHLSLDDFFAMIEDPASRYYSAVVQTSRYMDQIEAFEKVFPADHLCILMQDALKKDPDAVVAQVCHFLGVAPQTLAISGTKENVTADFLDGLDREEVTRRLRRYPFYKTLKSLIPEGMKSAIIGRMKHDTVRANPRFSAALRARLADTFKPANRELAARIGPLPATWHV